jgi:Arc/MetJ-type ribon-helix-helix transcriptional regulator
MSKQISVRLPDELVDFLDEVVSSGGGRSRAAVVGRALERERRRMLAARDAQILARSGSDPELAGLGEHVAYLQSALADSGRLRPDDAKAGVASARRLARMVRGRSIPVDVQAAEEVKRLGLVAD